MIARTHGSTLRERKRLLRRELGAKRRSVPPPAALAAAREVALRVLGLAEIARASRVGLYAALPDELPSRPLFEALAQTGCRRLLPRAVEGGGLAFAEVERWEDLRAGRFGVLEPPAGALALVPGPGDVVVVPGVAFDREGHRLGRGGGHYDQTFPPDGRQAPLLVGVGYAFQLVASLPCDSHDRRMDAIVTEHCLHRAIEADG